MTSWLPLSSIFGRAVFLRAFWCQLAGVFAFAILDLAFLLIDQAGSDDLVNQVLNTLPKRIVEIAIPLGVLLGASIALGTSRRDATINELEQRGTPFAWFALHSSYAAMPFAIVGVLIGTTIDSQSNQLEEQELVALWQIDDNRLTLAVPKELECGLEHLVELKVPERAADFNQLSGLAASNLPCDGANISLAGKMKVFGDADHTALDTLTWRQPASLISKDWQSLDTLLYAAAQSPEALNTKRAVLQTTQRLLFPLLLPLLALWLILALDRTLHSSSRNTRTWTAIAGVGALMALVLILFLDVRSAGIALSSGLLSPTIAANLTLVVMMLATVLAIAGRGHWLLLSAWLVLDLALVTRYTSEPITAVVGSCIIGLFGVFLLRKWQHRATA